MLRQTTLLPLLITIAALLAYGCSPYEVGVGRRCPEGVEQCDAVLDGQGADASTEAGDGPGWGFWEKPDATGDDVRPTGNQKTNACVPGYYKGAYEVPLYKGTPAGLCGLITPPMAGMAGRWEFRLPMPGAAAGDVMLVDTCLEYEAVPAGVSPQPSQLIRTEFKGTLDCATGQLEGELKGAYSSEGWCDGGEPAWYSIKATVTGTFDAERGAFAGGSVDIYEREALLPLPDPLDRNGGKGYWWAAAKAGDEGDTPTKDCLVGVPFDDFEVSP